MNLHKKIQQLPNPCNNIIGYYITPNLGKNETIIGIGMPIYHLLAPKRTLEENQAYVRKILDNISNIFQINRADINMGFCNDFETATAGYPIALHYLYRYSPNVKYEYGPHSEKGLNSAETQKIIKNIATMQEKLLQR